MLNASENRRFNYYFDSKFSESKSIHYYQKKYLYGLVIIVFLISAVGLYFINTKYSRTDEQKRIASLIMSLGEIYRYYNLTPAEVLIISDKIVESGEKYDLDPELLLAVISVESSFNKDAVSKNGARGLMQLMPGTAEHISKKIGIEYTGKSKIHDLEVNIEMGAYYLSKLSEKYKGNTKLFLIAYNQGPANLDEMLRNKKPLPLVYYSKIMDAYRKFTF